MIHAVLAAMNTTANFIFFAAAVPAVAFPLRYLKSAWRSSPVGRSMMMLSASIAAIFLASLIQIIWPDYWFRPVVRLVLYTFLTIALWRNLGTLVQAQREQVQPPQPKGHEVYNHQENAS